VFDVRVNEGGGNTIALLAASNFASERTLAYTLRTVNGDGFTNMTDVFIPIGDPAYRHFDKVIVIISESCVSAGETFSLAMAQLPQTTFLGRNTAAVFSDTLKRSLPNGWLVGLSNEVVAAPDGTVYEKVGIPPDIVPVAELLPLSERDAGVDSWLELAIATAKESAAPTSAPTSSAANNKSYYCAPLWVASIIMWTFFNKKFAFLYLKTSPEIILLT
jgi:C-terminal processing protease CtpA/Prc